MRTKETILDDIFESINSGPEWQIKVDGAVLEVLLDIRDLLQNPPLDITRGPATPHTL